MIHDNATHHVLKISELSRLIASHLVLTNQKSAVNLARACRYLEEPTLSILWGAQQWSLCTLLKVLPKGTWEYPSPDEDMFTIVGDPSPVAWGRVWRYASWMRRVDVGEWPILGGDTFLKLRLNSPPSGWFPALRALRWHIRENNLPYADLFFSPHLEEIYIITPFSWDAWGVPLGILPAIASAFSTLPTSNLKSLVTHGRTGIPCAYLMDSLSSVVMRCGPSFTRLHSPVPLSDAAVNHLMQLPHLSTWVIRKPPPSYSSLFLPLTFPPLETLMILKDGVVRGWFSLFNRLEEGVSTTQEVAPLSKVKQSLKALTIKYLPGLTADTSLASPIQRFRNLTHLDVDIDCHEGQCTFKLNNDDVTELAVALPRLESFCFGRTCRSNTCATTVACLLPISVHCLGLQVMEIHFNTTNIVEDFKGIPEDPRLQHLRSLPRCQLRSLGGCYKMPLILDEPGVETVAKGMIDISPSLRRPGGGGSWVELADKIEELREM